MRSHEERGAVAPAIQIMCEIIPQNQGFGSARSLRGGMFGE